MHKKAPCIKRAIYINIYYCEKTYFLKPVFFKGLFFKLY